MSAATLPPEVNLGPTILISVSIVTLVALVSVLTRLYVRKFMVKFLGWDDYTITFAMILSIVGWTLILPQVKYGAGRHIQYLKNHDEVVEGLKLNFVMQPIYQIAIATVKVSVGIFLLKLTPVKAFRIALLSVQGWNAANTLVAFTTVLTQCQPLNFIWDGVTPAKCFTIENSRLLAFINQAGTIIGDLLLTVAPVIILWNIQLNIRVKLSLMAILSLGVFASSASMVKLIYINSYGATGDVLFDTANLTIWTGIECNVGILAASIPCVKPLFKRILHGSSYASNAPRSTGYAQQKSSRSRTMKSKTGKVEDFELFPRNTTTISTNKVLHDNMSEESILHDRYSGVSHGIIKSVDVSVENSAHHGTKVWVVEDRV